MSQSKLESGAQSPPPSYYGGIATPFSSSLQHDGARVQCEHTALGMDKLGIHAGQSVHNNEKLNCQRERHSKETEELDLQEPKSEIGKEGGKWKWETKKEDIKRKWATKRGDTKRRWERAKDDMRLKWPMKVRGDEAGSYAPLNENEKGSGNRRGSNVPLGENVKLRQNKRHTRAALAGDSDATVLAAVASVALFSVVFF
ncbi:hypothetical protein V500_06121 [Pseudogymnoascus sp. VKM F-4518 (FW-2643)]|nr:hypothetical protein V500_06121 [Pseudogymnoascus sp. VKM F-4518 (FW-2643)]